MITSATLRVVPRGSKRKPGRTPGSPPNRDAILAAARHEFTRRGYKATTMRAIAGRAGVNSALVHHYFGSKDQLFAEAYRLAASPDVLVARLFEGDRETMGERLMHQVLDGMESGPGGGPMVGLLNSASTHEGAARALREIFAKALVSRLAASGKLSRPELRAALCQSQIWGMIVARFVVGLEPIKSLDREALVALYAPTLQRYLTGELPDVRTDETRVVVHAQGVEP